MAQITGALRSATGKHHHVACGKPFGDEARQHDLVVSSDAERLRVAAGFLDGSGEDRGIRVIDRAWGGSAHPVRRSRRATRLPVVVGPSDRNELGSDRHLSLPCRRSILAGRRSEHARPDVRRDRGRKTGMTYLTRRSVLRSSVGLAAAGTLARPYIANAAGTTAEVWWVQGFVPEEDVAFTGKPC